MHSCVQINPITVSKVAYSRILTGCVVNPFSSGSGTSVDGPAEKHGASNSIADLLQTINPQSMPKQQM